MTVLDYILLLIAHCLGWFVLSHLIALIFYGERDALIWKHCVGNGVYSFFLHIIIVYLTRSF